MTHKIIMTNEKNGFSQNEVFNGTLEECKNYLEEEKKIVEKDDFDVSQFEENILSGYGGYGKFTYQIEEVEKIDFNNFDTEEFLNKKVDTLKTGSEILSFIEMLKEIAFNLKEENICPECDDKLEYKMFEVDKTNLEEFLSCSCGYKNEK